VNEEVIIPLAAAVRAIPLVARKKDEVRLKLGGWWTVPRCSQQLPTAAPAVQHLCCGGACPAVRVSLLSPSGPLTRFVS
jgi:hypothetical protein